MTPGPSERDGLERVLVLTARKGFWASSEAERFPHRVETPIVTGHSTSVINTMLLALRALPALVRVRPRVIVTGSAHRLVPPLLVLRRLRLLRARLVVTNQVFFGPRWGRYADRVIVYSSRETEGRPTYRYLPIPADGDYAAVVPRSEEAPYVFSGGGSLRDFASLAAAVAGSGLRLVLVTDSPETLGVAGALPPECEVHWRMPLQDFLGWAAGALCVVVPLRPGADPHGHTTVAQALRLGAPWSRRATPASTTTSATAWRGCSSTQATSRGIAPRCSTLAGDDALRAAARGGSTRARAGVLLRRVRRGARDVVPGAAGGGSASPGSGRGGCLEHLEVAVGDGRIRKGLSRSRADQLVVARKERAERGVEVAGPLHPVRLGHLGVRPGVEA